MSADYEIHENNYTGRGELQQPGKPPETVQYDIDFYQGYHHTIPGQPDIKGLGDYRGSITSLSKTRSDYFPFFDESQKNAECLLILSAHRKKLPIYLGPDGEVTPRGQMQDL